MCELLIKAVDATHPDPAIDASLCYKRGDVVVIKPDGHEWGTGELDESVFRIVKMPGVSVENMAYLIAEHPEPLRQTAVLKIPALRRHLQNSDRPIAIRRRHKIDQDTQQIIDKTRP